MFANLFRSRQPLNGGRRPPRRAKLSLESLRDRIVPSQIVSPDGRHTADILYGQYGLGFGWYVLRDTHPVGGPYVNGPSFGLAYTGHYGFSLDSQHLVWNVLTGFGWQVYEDSDLLGTGQYNSYDVGFSPDSQHYVFVINSGDPIAPWSVHVDATAGDGTSWPNLRTIGFSPDSRFFMYAVETSHGEEIHSIPLSGSVASTTTTLSSSQNPSVYGQAVTFTATVSAVPPGSGTPTGSVTFAIDGQNQAPVALDQSGQARLTLASLGVGAHTIGANYTGGTGFAPSSANLLAQTVAKASSSTTLSASPNPSVYGQSVTFTATVSAVAPGSGTPTGSVTFTIDGQNQAPVALNAAARASLTLASLGVGSHTITASYGGSADFLASPASAPLVQTVTPGSPDHFLVVPSVSTTTAGTAFDVTVTVQDAFNNTVPTYTGTIAFDSSDPGATLPHPYAFTPQDVGVHRFANGITLIGAGRQNIRASSTGGLTGSALVTVSPATATSFSIDAPASVVAGRSFGITVTARDSYGNFDTNYHGTVTFTTSDPDPGVVLPGDYTFTAADAGVHSFTDTGLGETTLITRGYQSLTVTNTADGSVMGSATVRVKHLRRHDGGSPGRHAGQDLAAADRFFAALVPEAFGWPASPFDHSGNSLT